MSYLSDEQIHDRVDEYTLPYRTEITRVVKEFRDLYEAHLKEKDELLREALAKVPTWISVEDRLPDDRQDVIVGHASGQWVREDVRFIEGVFRIRHNAQRGGDAGFKQMEEAKELKLPADQILWSANCNPTHWMPFPSPPLPHQLTR